jgi:predicted transcriptional regulator
MRKIFNRQVLLRLPDGLHQVLQSLAEEKGLNLSSLIRYALTEYIKREKPNNPAGDSKASLR